MSLMLVTTADEQSWDPDLKTLFLGEWCRLHTRKKVWESMDFLVSNPYGLNSEIQQADHELINKIYCALLEEISTLLNNYHSENHSNRYWEIIIGHWLYHFIKMLLGRYRELEFAFNNYEITSTIVLNNVPIDLLSYDHISYMHKLRNDNVNHLIYSEMIRQFFHKKIKIIYKEYKFEPLKNIVPINFKLTKKLRNKAYQFFLCVYSKLHRNSDALIINSYLPFFEEIKLQIRLGQFPVIWRTPALNKIKYESFNSKRLQLSTHGFFGFDNVVRFMLAKMIPVVYLEGYRGLKKQIKALPFPSRPKFIFSSNNFAYDELFKAWTAQKTEEGISYFIGQHGSNYGTLKSSLRWPEINTCDKFISWGWSKVYSKVNTIKAFNFKVANKILTPNSAGGLLLVERGPGYRDGPQDRFYEHILYQQYVFDFYDELSDSIKEKTIIRLHHGSSDHSASDVYLWNKKYPNSNIDDFFLPLEKLIQKSRIIAFSYECSGFLECMALNIPTICFWRGSLNHLFEEASLHYQMLKEVGIMTNDAREVASYINTHWQDVDSWWRSQRVQVARSNFCNRYSRTVIKPSKELATLLLENVS